MTFGQPGFRGRAAGLLHLHDTPRRTAAAFALGTAIGFSPFVGVHAALGVLLAFLFGLNRVAVVAGTFANVPWLMPPYYAATTSLGAWLTRTNAPAHLLVQLDTAWHLATWTARMAALGALLRPFALSFVLGSSLVAGLIGLVVYQLALPILTGRSRRAS